MRARTLVVIVTLLASIGVADAEQRNLSFDPEQAEIGFVLGATMHKVHGTLRMERGEVIYDPATGQAAGEIVLDARSADTGNEKRDRDMHRKVLESERYPSIVLEVVRVEGTLPTDGEGTMTVIGSIALHGSDHEVSIPIDVVTDGDALSVETVFEVPYVDWGLKDPSKFVLRVQKHVTVSLRASGSLTPAGADENVSE
jgi:polyisoprenoid-binding protein YceI